MKLKLIVGLAVAVLLATRPCASAGEHKKFDLDGNGKLDHHELKLALEKELALLDKDHDGKKGMAEGRAALAALFEKLDKDHDGKLDHGEVREALRKLREHHPILYEHVVGHINEHRLKK